MLPLLAAQPVCRLSGLFPLHRSVHKNSHPLSFGWLKLLSKQRLELIPANLLFLAAGGTLADQWKEFFYCDALDQDVLVVKGQKRISNRSSNTKGNDNIISNGSGIAVADGQCMIIVEQGKVVEVCAEPGQFTYDSSTEPSA